MRSGQVRFCWVTRWNPQWCHRRLRVEINHYTLAYIENCDRYIQEFLEALEESPDTSRIYWNPTGPYGDVGPFLYKARMVTFLRRQKDLALKLMKKQTLEGMDKAFIKLMECKMNRDWDMKLHREAWAISQEQDKQDPEFRTDYE